MLIRSLQRKIATEANEMPTEVASSASTTVEQQIPAPVTEPEEAPETPAPVPVAEETKEEETTKIENQVEFSDLGTPLSPETIEKVINPAPAAVETPTPAPAAETKEATKEVATPAPKNKGKNKAHKESKKAPVTETTAATAAAPVVPATPGTRALLSILEDLMPGERHATVKKVQIVPRTDKNGEKYTIVNVSFFLQRGRTVNVETTNLIAEGLDLNALVPGRVLTVSCFTGNRYGINEITDCVIDLDGLTGTARKLKVISQAELAACAIELYRTEKITNATAMNDVNEMIAENLGVTVVGWSELTFPFLAVTVNA